MFSKESVLTSTVFELIPHTNLKEYYTESDKKIKNAPQDFAAYDMTSNLCGTNMQSHV